MNYAYYPGCSLERNANAYHKSAVAVAARLGLDLQEIEDWNCCGSTEYVSIDLLPAYALIGRNLAIAAQNQGPGKDLVAPCSACFLNLKKVDHYMSESAELAEKVNLALEAGGLHYEPGSVRVRHLLEIFVNDAGGERIAEKVTRPLYNLRVAPYYGCLIARPSFDQKNFDPEYPTELDDLLGVLGAEVVDFPLKTHCCGGHMTQISEEVALGLIRHLLSNAAAYDADVIAVACPMCQLNLDAYQDLVNRHFKTKFRIPILYFTQLLGLAMGLKAKDLGFGKEFIDASVALTKIGVKPPKKGSKQKRSKEALPMPSLTKEV